MKALTRIFAFLFFVMLINPAFAQAFPDVDENHWAYKEIEILAKEGVVVGYPDGNFKADSLVDRAEFSSMVIKALGQEHSPIQVEINFQDVPYSHWAYSLIQRAVYFDLIDGKEKNFYPEGFVSKAHAISVSINALSPIEISETRAISILSKNYDDFLAIPKNMIMPAAKAEIVGINAKNPKHPRMLNIQGYATRAELAVLVYKMREEAKLNPNAKLAESMRPKKGEGIVVKNATIDKSIGIIPKNTKLPFVLVDNMSTLTNEAGEVFILNTPQNLISKEGYILVLSNSNVAGEIDDVRIGKYFVRNGKLFLHTNLISTPIRQKTDLKGDVDAKQKKNWLARIFHAIFKGDNINLKKGDVVYIKTKEDIKVDLSCGWILP